MSSGWSWWVIFLIVLNMGITFSLYLWAPRARIPMRPDGTTGHVWAHGTIMEGLQRLPTWWVVFSGSMFAAAFIYLFLFPGFGNHKGALGWTSHGQLARDVSVNEAKLDPLMTRFRLYPVEQLAGDAQARQMGKELFEDNCAACHQRSGKGNALIGAPDLTDSDWLYGGTGKDITTSIHDGRNGVMPPWASLGEDNVNNLVQYVLSLSGAPHDAAKAAAGKPLFTTCEACHGPGGKGNEAIGAPNLTDHVWLYGGTVADIHQTIHDGRQGHMPTWSPRLSDDKIHVIAAYVYHLSHPDDANPH